MSQSDPDRGLPLQFQTCPDQWCIMLSAGMRVKPVGSEYSYAFCNTDQERRRLVDAALAMGRTATRSVRNRGTLYSPAQSPVAPCRRPTASTGSTA